ncbi:hypothetical protein BX666DRAFT_1334099 [Dichotomocladium elegans]|nr:hypothetical protein BX666DRAFT_1334099 [Dichotomocladium elegans]
MCIYYTIGCSLLDQTIFCYGGYTEISTDTATNAFFGLNISQPITKISAETSWVDLTKPSNNVVLEANANFAMTSVPQRGLLFVSGGDGYNHTDLDRQVSIYFASNNTWVNVAVPQSDFEQMFDETAVADAQGNNVYLWGGETVQVASISAGWLLRRTKCHCCSLLRIH